MLLSVKKTNFTNSDDNMYLTVCFLIEINKIQTASSDISLRKNDVNLYGFGEIYMDK